MAKVADQTPVLDRLPEGVREIKRYRDGRRLVACERHRLRMTRGPFGTGYACITCRMATSNKWPDPSQWPAVKMVVRVYGIYEKWMGVDSKKLKQWLRHWKKQVADGKGDLVYDPEEEVRMLTEELRSRGDL